MLDGHRAESSMVFGDIDQYPKYISRHEAMGIDCGGPGSASGLPVGACAYPSPYEETKSSGPFYPVSRLLLYTKCPEQHDTSRGRGVSLTASVV